MQGSKRFRACLVAAALSAAPLVAQERAARSQLEVGVFDGAILPDKRLTATVDPGVEPTFGVRVGGGITWQLNWFGEAQFARFTTSPPAGEADMLAARGGVEWLIDPGRRAEPFLSAGWGYMNVSFDGASDFFSSFASLGLGQHVQLGAHTRLRWEIRADRTMADDGLRGRDLTLPQATVGFSWVVGGRNRDTDADGIPGRRDRCPDTPAGAQVDANGCALDTDRDSVANGLDACPETPEGWAVGPDGCPLDADGDGVTDGADRCPATPRGVVIDEHGCPQDTDRDGVPDGLDQCPNTLNGIEVDKRGCFLDADEDGVYDGLGMDRCPGTPKGTPVDPFGCPLKDNDED